jgi:hypothetical protein
MGFFPRDRSKPKVSKPLVRPWALAAPILVILVALPLLRPLRHPDANEVSDDEAARLATVAAIVDHHTLALENLNLGPDVPLPGTGLIRSHDHVYSIQPPVWAVMLAGIYFLLTKWHLTFVTAPILTPYILTLVGVTIPVAAAAGLIYKMARVFELRRSLRCALAVVVIFGTGMISYAVVLNPHAPAAALVLGSAGALIHVVNSRKPRRNIYWFIASGACAGLAMTIDPPAAVFAMPIMLVIFATRWSIVRRIAGVGLFIIGIVPPLFLHLALNHPITGDWKPALFHRELAMARTGDRADLADWGTVGAALTPATPPNVGDEDQPNYGDFQIMLRPTLRLAGCLFGSHGVLSHFPVLLLGMLGIAGMLRKHWPTSIKCLAVATACGTMAIVVAYSITWADVRGAMFANRWFVVFLPLTMFWSGAWLRRPHRRLTWILAALLLIFSVTVSLLGATDPYPRGGYDRYTALAALHRLMTPGAGSIVVPPLAGADAN